MPKLEQVVANAAIEGGDAAIVVHIESIIAAHTVDPQTPVDLLGVIDALDIVVGIAVAVDAFINQSHHILAQQEEIIFARAAVDAVDRQAVYAVIFSAAVGQVNNVVAVARQVNNGVIAATLTVQVDGFAGVESRQHLLQGDGVIARAAGIGGMRHGHFRINVDGVVIIPADNGELRGVDLPVEVDLAALGVAIARGGIFTAKFGGYTRGDDRSHGESHAIAAAQPNRAGGGFEGHAGVDVDEVGCAVVFGDDHNITGMSNLTDFHSHRALGYQLDAGSRLNTGRRIRHAA